MWTELSNTTEMKTQFLYLQYKVSFSIKIPVFSNQAQFWLVRWSNEQFLHPSLHTLLILGTGDTSHTIHLCKTCGCSFTTNEIETHLFQHILQAIKNLPGCKYSVKLLIFEVKRFGFLSATIAEGTQTKPVLWYCSKTYWTYKIWNTYMQCDLYLYMRG